PLFPKFVSEGAAMYHELRKRGTSAVLNLKFLKRRRRNIYRNFKSTHYRSATGTNHPPPGAGFLCSASAAEDASSGSPDLSLASIFTRSSGSGLRSRACDHWKRASSTRPTLQ